MPDPRFFLTRGPLPVSEALHIAGVKEAGVTAGAVERAAALSDSDLAGAVIFINGEKALTTLAGKRFALCFAPVGVAVKAQGLDGP
ncbi:MAG: hypothetical protein KDE05_10190, partial [Parvularculaceae bacterium]|nr:hypothetical protein [Parvularculaceae bacterium]